MAARLWFSWDISGVAVLLQHGSWTAVLVDDDTPTPKS
jgi:hypothetical protein